MRLAKPAVWILNRTAATNGSRVQCGITTMYSRRRANKSAHHSECWRSSGCEGRKPVPSARHLQARPDKLIFYLGADP